MNTTFNTLKTSLRRQQNTEATHLPSTTSNGEELYQYEETRNMMNEHGLDFYLQTEGMLQELTLSKESSIDSTIADTDLRSTFGGSDRITSSGSS